MISEEKRRRIAKMLRDATEGHGDVPGIPDSEVFCILEIGTGFADGFADKTDVEALADLIDRPTTTRHGKFRTKYGRETPCCEVCGYSIGDMRWCFCPKCGAVITDD